MTPRDSKVFRGITVINGQYYDPGDILRIATPDTRWWKILWHKLTFQSPPELEQFVSVKDVINNQIYY